MIPLKILVQPYNLVKLHLRNLIQKIFILKDNSETLLVVKNHNHYILMITFQLNKIK